MQKELKQITISVKAGNSAENKVGSFAIPAGYDVTITVNGGESVRIIPAPPALPERLTRRELETAALLLEGLKRKGIAEKLNVAESTAKTFVSSLLKKSGCKSTLEFVLKYRHI